MALLDEEKYIEDGFIDTSYFGGLLQGEGLWTYYFQDNPAYIDPDYFDNRGGYFSLTADLTPAITEGAADLTSSFSISVVADKLILLSASLNSAFELSATGGFIEQFDLSMVGTAELIAEATVKVGLSSNINSAIGVDVEGIMFKGVGDIDLATSVQLTTNGGFLRLANSNLTSTLNIGTTDYIRRRNTTVDITAFYTQTVTAGQLLSDTANLLAQFSTDAQLNTIFRSPVDLNSSTALDVDAVGTFVGESALSASATLTATGLRIKQLASDLNSEFAVGHLENGDFANNVDGTAILDGSADLTGVFSPNITANLTRTTDIAIAISSSIGVTGNLLRTTDAQITGVFASSATPTRIFPLDTDLQCEFNSVADGSVIVEAGAQINGLFNSVVTVVATRTDDADLFANFGITATPTITRGLEGNLQTVVNCAAQPVAFYSAGVSISMRATLNSTGGFFTISDIRQFSIPRENRTCLIVAESRTARITRENRTISISGVAQ